MTRISLAVFVFGGALTLSPLAHAAARPASQAAPAIGARAAILIDARTGTILYEKNAFLQLDPASLTKMMTALLVIEHGHLNQVVTVSKRSDNTPGSSLHIVQNQQYTRLDLLKGMLLRSGNDASVALAESDAGSVEQFVAEMNVRAQQLGAFNTAFENTHGLTKPGHYSSAYDMALIARTALKIPLFQEIVRSPEATVTELRHGHRRSINSTNSLLYGFPGADGVKTGTTDAAGKCLVGSATRDRRQLIVVVLNSPDRYGDASRLLNWGFGAWHEVRAVDKGQELARRPVEGGVTESVGLASHRSVWLEVPKTGSYETVLALPARVKAPVTRQTRVGFATVLEEGQPPVRIGLYATSDVARKSSAHRFWEWLFRRR